MLWSSSKVVITTIHLYSYLYKYGSTVCDYFYYQNKSSNATTLFRELRTV